MKRIIILAFFLPLLAFSQKQLVLTGKLTNLKEGAKVHLVDINTPTDTVGKAVVKNGEFVIKGKLEKPTLLSLNLDNGKRASLFLDNSKVNITGDANDPKLIATKGSPTQEVFEQFQAKFNPLFETLSKTNQQLQFSRNDSLVEVANKVRSGIQAEIDAFIAKHRASPVSSFLLAITYQLVDDILLTEKRLNSLDVSAKDNLYGKYLGDVITETKLFAVGSPAIEFTQNDTLGNPVSLSSFRGKYVLLDFWASWCGPCRQENPNVVYNYNKFKDKKFTVLGVSLDRPGQKEKWLQAIHADNLTWTHVSDLKFWNNEVAMQYKIQSIPQNFLIGPDGKIVAKNLRGPDLESKLCELLGCN